MELFRALGALIEPPDTSSASERLRLARLLDLADAEAELPPGDVYTDLFLFQLYPYASVYLGPEGMMGGDARDRIAGFLRALGATPPKEPDHLAYLLAAYADLGAQDDDTSGDPKLVRARKAFLWEHLLSWLPAWLHALRRLDPPAFYRRWADLLDESLRREAALLGPPDELPLHLRESPPLADAASNGQNSDAQNSFLQALLAPARAGLVLVRDDLRRAAEQLGLGLRAGERRYVLKHLLGQDSSAVLPWLANEALDWEEFWAGQTWLGDVAEWWQGRAAEAARTVRDGMESESPA